MWGSLGDDGIELYGDELEVVFLVVKAQLENKTAHLTPRQQEVLRKFFNMPGHKEAYRLTLLEKSEQAARRAKGRTKKHKSK